MAEKRRFLDVWIVETNTVYKEVPFAIVSDWVQQGRLLEDDRTKPSGTKDWFRLGDTPDLTPYLPRPEPHRPTDEAEALEPVMLDFTYKRPQEEDDDDVDMIPLIDVSLVLLIFFMLTAGAATYSSTINTPQAEVGDLIEDPSGMRIDISVEKDGTPVYSLGMGANRRKKTTRIFIRWPPCWTGSRHVWRGRPNRWTLSSTPTRISRRRCRATCCWRCRADPFRDKINQNFFGVSGVEP